MYLERPGVSKRSLLIGITFGVLVLLFIISFWNEIIQSFQFLWGLVTFGLLPNSVVAPPVSGSWSVAVVCFNVLFGFGLVFAGWLFLLSRQAVLPVNSFMDVWRTTWHLFLYTLRLHGPAIFVKDGKALVTRQDSRRVGPGVVVVDFNSAVVLEELILPLRPGENLAGHYPKAVDGAAPGGSLRITSRPWLRGDLHPPARTHPRCGGFAQAVPHAAGRSAPTPAKALKSLLT